MNKKALASLLAAAAISLPTHAALLTFDDLNLEVNEFEVLANGYQGLNWTNFRALNPGDETTATTYRNSGYLNGRVSAPNVAYNGFANPASLSSATPFLLISGSFAAAWADGLSIFFVGYLGNEQVIDLTATVSSTAPSSIRFNKKIDQLTISTVCDETETGGCKLLSDAPAGGFNFVLDNLQIGEATNPVPEPGALTLIASGLLGLGLMRVSRANERTRA